MAAVTSHARTTDVTPGRWRAFADAVALALGANLWVSLVLLPGLVAGALHTLPEQLSAVIPLGVLGLGVWRRSELVLLLGFPSGLLVPLALAPEMANVHVYGPIRFAIVAVGLVGYLFGASIFTSFREPPPPVGRRPLASASRPVPERWRRRFRIYAALAGLSLLFPLVLLYTINFDDTAREFMLHRYPGRVAALTAVMNLGAVSFWVLVYFWFFLGVLRPHRTGDRDLVTDLDRIRQQTGRARPRPQFYLGVGCALILMIILLLLRHG
ncbi:MAG TPA: hypothetical protein VKB80_20125 [Kofleriaceae bacterium]|nr:hypothetical protein [Kofleriaceae bacterium]